MSNNRAAYMDANQLWKRCYRYRSEAAQASERGDDVTAERLTVLADRTEKRALETEREHERYGVFVWGGSPIHEPGDRG